MSSDANLDPDKSIAPQLEYSLVDSNVEYFSVERFTGVVTVINQNLSKNRYRFNVKVSDSMCPALVTTACSCFRLVYDFHSKV